MVNIIYSADFCSSFKNKIKTVPALFIQRNKYRGYIPKQQNLFFPKRRRFGEFKIRKNKKITPIPFLLHLQFPIFFWLPPLLYLNGVFPYLTRFLFLSHPLLYLKPFSLPLHLIIDFGFQIFNFRVCSLFSPFDFSDSF